MAKSQTKRLKAAALRTQKENLAEYHNMQNQCINLARHIKATGDYNGYIK